MEKIIIKLDILQKHNLYLNQFSNKKGATGKPERPERHSIWAAYLRTHLSTKYPPPPPGKHGREGRQIERTKLQRKR